MYRMRMLKPMLPSLVLGAGLAAPAAGAPLSIDDVLNTVAVDRVSISPDGREVAIVVQRPPSRDEVAGRAPYEIDPSRNDVWLIGSDGGNLRNLTVGAKSAAGYWCPQWSPTGERLAMLSTQPERDEVRGGDAVRLYVWSRSDQTVSRLSNRAVMTQTRYGSPLNALDLKGGPVSGGKSEACRSYNENAPFLWLDERRILLVQMPLGQNSALFAQYGRPAENAGEVARRLREGRETTVDVADTDRAVLAASTARYTAEIVVIDVVTARTQVLAQVPAYPFRGMLSLSVSPDRKSAALLAPIRAVPPSLLGPAPSLVQDTQVEKRLGVLALDGTRDLKWLPAPPTGRYPLDLLDWSPDSKRFAFRARASADDPAARTFVVSRSGGRIELPAPSLVSDASDVGTFPHELSAAWDDRAGLLVRGRPEADPDAASRWWRVAVGEPPRPAARAPDEEPLANLPQDAEVLARRGSYAIWQLRTPTGVLVQSSGQGDAGPHNLLTLNSHLARVDWGRVETIRYTGRGGQDLKGLVVLPPDYKRGARYPLAVWVYPGTIIRGEKEYWSDKYLPGIYNLQLYAAQGYVVLVPSMPLPAEVGAGGLYRVMPDGVLPAIDKAVDLGMVDPRRVAVFGHSWGGYAVYALVSQTDRFKAAVAISGITDYTAMHGNFDRGAAGWMGISQDKSENAAIAEANHRLQLGPFADPVLYATNSPITYVAKVETPLLMAHGSLDSRAGIEHAQSFFTELDRQGKRARLLQYQGEDHAIALSSANVRSLFGEIVAWLRRYLQP